MFTGAASGHNIDDTTVRAATQRSKNAFERISDTMTRNDAKAFNVRKRKKLVTLYIIYIHIYIYSYTHTQIHNF